MNANRQERKAILKSVKSSVSCSRLSRLCLVVLALQLGCAHSPQSRKVESQATAINLLRGLSLTPAKIAQPVVMRLKGDAKNIEKVAYFNRVDSHSYEDGQLRHQREESLKFTSQAETLANDPAAKYGSGVFTQEISTFDKDGSIDLHDFALPEPGEKLHMVFDEQGRILVAEGYPTNSIFYVPPVSLPSEAVSIGDTWTMDAKWFSLNEMIPYQLEMVSILKGLWECGTHSCAEIEISGDVGFQGQLSQAMSFHSTWHGTIYFDIDAGTVAWSRTDSEERLLTDNVRRDVSSCLESVLIEPKSYAMIGISAPTCEPFNALPVSSANPSTQPK